MPLKNDWETGDFFGADDQNAVADEVNGKVDGTDPRLSDARTPTAHNHAAADVTSGTFAIARIPTGTSSSTVCVGNDSRLSNTRTPTDDTVSTAKLQNGAVTTAKIGDGQVTAAKLASAVLANRPEFHVGTNAPVDTTMLWVDTN